MYRDAVDHSRRNRYEHFKFLSRENTQVLLCGRIQNEHWLQLDGTCASHQLNAECITFKWPSLCTAFVCVILVRLFRTISTSCCCFLLWDGLRSWDDIEKTTTKSPTFAHHLRTHTHYECLTQLNVVLCAENFPHYAIRITHFMEFYDRHWRHPRAWCTTMTMYGSMRCYRESSIASMLGCTIVTIAH